jgi:hypothetical protein
LNDLAMSTGENKSLYLKKNHKFAQTFARYSTDRTKPNTRANPERTRDSLPGFALCSLLKILRSLWVSSESALGPLWVCYLGALYALMREADPAFILLLVTPPLVYSKNLHGSDFSHCWFCGKINKYKCNSTLSKLFTYKCTCTWNFDFVQWLLVWCI